MRTYAGFRVGGPVGGAGGDAVRLPQPSGVPSNLKPARRALTADEVHKSVSAVLSTLLLRCDCDSERSEPFCKMAAQLTPDSVAGVAPRACSRPAPRPSCKRQPDRRRGRVASENESESSTATDRDPGCRMGRAPIALESSPARWPLRHERGSLAGGVVCKVAANDPVEAEVSADVGVAVARDDNQRRTDFAGCDDRFSREAKVRGAQGSLTRHGASAHTPGCACFV